jgi:hypothetical protein
MREQYFSATMNDPDNPPAKAFSEMKEQLRKMGYVK